MDKDLYIYILSGGSIDRLWKKGESVERMVRCHIRIPVKIHVSLI